MAVRAGAAQENQCLDAVGPDIFTFNELLELIARTLGSRALRVHLPAELARSFRA